MKYTFLIIAAFAFLLTACGEEATTTVTDTSGNEATAEVTTEVADEEPPVASFPSDSVAPDGTGFYGNRISSEADYVRMDNLHQVVEEAGGSIKVRVAGEVEAACMKKGCWMTLKTGKEDQTMRVRFQDYGFFVPKDCSGKTAIVEGIASYDTTSIADLRHYAVDGGMSEEEAEKTITEPEIALTFMANGVVLK